MKRMIALASIAVLAASPAIGQEKRRHIDILKKNFEKVYVIDAPVLIWAPHDVPFFTVSTSMAHQSSIKEIMQGPSGSEYFTKGLKTFDTDGIRELYDYYADSDMWARYDWRVAHIALATNERITLSVDLGF